MLRMVGESSTMSARLGSRTRIERSINRLACAKSSGFAASASVTNGWASPLGAASRTVNGRADAVRAAVTTCTKSVGGKLLSR